VTIFFEVHAIQSHKVSIVSIMNQKVSFVDWTVGMFEFDLLDLFERGTTSVSVVEER